MTLLCVLAIAGGAFAQGPVSPPRPGALGTGSVVDRSLAPSDSHDYTVRLTRGMSVLITVQQIGVDVVAELRGPDARLLEMVDSPTGRSGEERVEFFADRSGTYSVRVRPFNTEEPAGRYRLTVVDVRGARATAAILGARALARDSAAAWLRSRAAALPATLDGELPPLDRIAGNARVIGLGEATHGSRELADLRFAVTRYLVQRHGVRLIAIEYSASRMAVLNSWALGGPVSETEMHRALNTGWIGRRTLGELVQWIRNWNATNPQDHVQLVGVDAQDNARARATLQGTPFREYAQEMIAGFDSALAEIAVADSQTWVFGDSRVSAPTQRTLVEVQARLDADAPLLAARWGPEAFEAVRDAARQLMQFADFNAGRAGTRSRDWYMAANLIRALNAVPAGRRAVFWSHNAHVAVPANPRTSGAFLRGALGCGYRALATSFGEGGFVAQRPNDLEDRLEISTLPFAPPETIDAVMASVFSAGSVATWTCEPRPDNVPAWLQSAQQLHWIGGLYAPGSLPTQAFSPFKLVEEFDGIFYLPKVTADQVFNDRPIVPARPR